MELSLNEAALLFFMVGGKIEGRDDCRYYPKSPEDALNAMKGKNYICKVEKCNGESLICDEDDFENDEIIVKKDPVASRAKQITLNFA